MKPEKLLIVSYVFPPYPGIGGRRWAKFAKYLTRNGYAIDVVCADNPFKETSAWITDVEGNNNIQTHPVKSFYPHVLTRSPRNIKEWFLQRFWFTTLRLRFKGYVFDRTVFSAKKFIKAVSSIIDENAITKVIVTGAPFHLVHSIAKLKSEKQSFKLLVDFRDPWTWEPGGSYQSLKSGDLNYEKKLELFVMSKTDLVTVPTKSMLSHLKETYPEFESKCFLLSHAWDAEEIIPQKKKPKEFIRLIWYGTLYGDIKNGVEELAKTFSKAKDKITLDIFSDSKKYSDVFDKYKTGGIVNYYDIISSSKLYAILNQYDAAIIFNNDTDKDHISTKFIELAATHTPIIYIAGKGITSQFLIDYNLGWHVLPSEVGSFFTRLPELMAQYSGNTLNIDDYKFDKVTTELIELISG